MSADRPKRVVTAGITHRVEIHTVRDPAKRYPLMLDAWAAGENAKCLLAQPEIDALATFLDHYRTPAERDRQLRELADKWQLELNSAVPQSGHWSAVTSAQDTQLRMCLAALRALLDGQPAEDQSDSDNGFDIADFGREYRFKMVHAYPIISGVSDAYAADHDEIDAGFAHVLAARNLRRTHELHLADQGQPAETGGAS